MKLAPHLDHVGVLMEPTTVVAKAWEQVERVGARSWFEPRRRALPSNLVAAGSTLGPVIAAPALAWVIVRQTQDRARSLFGA